MTVISSPFYSPQPYIASYSATSVANLPNRSGSNTTVTSLAIGQICQVGAQFYMCDSPTSGSAVWFLLPSQPKDPLGRDRIQTVSASSATIVCGIDRVVVTYASGACTLTLPSVLEGAPIGTVIIVEKANTSANGIVMTPDSGSNINGGTTDATQALVGLNNTASTTASSASTNDIATKFVRISATQWRSTPV